MKREELVLIAGLIVVLLIALIWHVADVRTDQADLRIRMVALEDRQALLSSDLEVGITIFWTEADELLRGIQSLVGADEVGMPPRKASARKPAHGPSGEGP